MNPIKFPPSILGALILADIHTPVLFHCEAMSDAIKNLRQVVRVAGVQGSAAIEAAAELSRTSLLSFLDACDVIAQRIQNKGKL